MRLFALAAVITALSTAPAVAAPVVDGVFDLPGVTTNGQLTVGPDGNIWVALEDAVGRVTPGGVVTVFKTADLNNTLGSPTGGITSASGFIWVAQTPAGKKPIVKIPPANPAGATEIAVPDITAGPNAMTLGPDGNIWTVLTGRIVRFSPSAPATNAKFLIAGLLPRGITSASDGTLWVTDVGNGGQLLNVTTAGVQTPYPVTGGPQGVAAGPDAQVVYANPNSTPQQIGRLSPGGTAQTLDRPNGSDPFGVAFGNDGAYWIAEFAGNRLARVTTDGQLTTLSGFPAVAGQGPRQIVAGPNNTLWATIDKPGDSANTKIARIAGVELPPPPTGQTPTGQTPTTTPPPPDKTAPLITNVALIKTAARVRVNFTLSEAGTLKIELARAARGQRHGKRCLKPSARRKRAKRCTRYLRIRALGRTGTAGLNRIDLNTRELRAGRYRVVFSATDAAGNRSAAVTRTFTIRR